MRNSNFFENLELQEVDDADDTVYEYGLPEEEEGGFIGTLSNLVAPARREVIKAPEEKQVPLEELGMDSIPGETMTVKTPGEYGPVETDFSYAPIVRGAKSVLDYGKKLFSDEQTQEDTVQALKAAPAAAVEGGGKFLEDQMAAAMGMSAGYSSVNRPDGEVARFDPLAFTGAVAPAGIAAVSSAKAGETVLGIFGSTMGMGSKKRFAKFTEEVENAEDLQFDTPEAREEYLFQKSKGVFVDEAGDPRFEIATKDVDLLPYFKRRNVVEGTSDTYEVATDPTMRTETVLADVLKFDELFKEYPALKSYRVVPLPEEDMLDGTKGIFYPSTTTLAVAPLERKEFISVLLHEVQHAVDDLEGFQSGSNPEMFATAIMKEADFKYEQLTAERNNFFSFLTDKETSDSFDKYTPDELKILKSKEHRKLMPIAFSGADFAEPMDEFRDLYKPIIAKMADWEKKTFDNLVQTQKESIELSDLANIDSKEAFRKYRETPGEVDARNVQKRFLNPELQLSSLPKKTADTDKLFGLINKRGDKVSSVSKNTDTMTAAGLTQKDVDAWRKANETSEEFRKRLKGRSETLQSLAKGLKDKDITVKEYREAADAIRPIRRVTDIPRPATSKEIISALGGREGGRGIVGLNRNIPDGEEISARLDINAYTNYDVWIPTLMHQKKTLYSPSVSLRNVKFIQPDSPAVNKALKVATGSEKSPFAVMTGNYNKMSDSDAFDYTKQVFDDDEWIQIGYDPTRRGYFYDRADGAPVLEAEEVVQIGHLVLAKKARKGNPEDFTFAKGGLMARR
tara:strand:+ start:225 stop:2609 length:2385 start_codon:yes stop_codon:yes gene_type:complete